MTSPPRALWSLFAAWRLLNFDEQGDADYAGETKVDWDQQTSLLDARGRVTLECPDGHQWQAKPDNVPDWKQ